MTVAQVIKCDSLSTVVLQIPGGKESENYQAATFCLRRQNVWQGGTPVMRVAAAVAK